MAEDWASYDSVAAEYQRVSHPNFFRRPAEDLAALLELGPSTKLLDVGAGTGAVSGAAAKHIDGEGCVVALDLSRDMLRQAVSDTEPQPVMGRLPFLPFRAGAFDAAAANFLLNHLADWQAGLGEMARVLRPGGVIAATNWLASNEVTDLARIFRETLERFAPDGMLHEAREREIPSEAILNDPEVTRSALDALGFERITITERTYEGVMSLEDYVDNRSISLSGRRLKQHLPPADWRRFQEDYRKALERRFPDEVQYTNSAYFAVGVKG